MICPPPANVPPVKDVNVDKYKVVVLETLITLVGTQKAIGAVAKGVATLVW